MHTSEIYSSVRNYIASFLAKEGSSNLIFVPIDNSPSSFGEYFMPNKMIETAD
jgi:hypothetical protein